MAADNLEFEAEPLHSDRVLDQLIVPVPFLEQGIFERHHELSSLHMRPAGILVCPVDGNLTHISADDAPQVAWFDRVVGRGRRFALVAVVWEVLLFAGYLMLVSPAVWW
jgi:hypothetical protein